MLGSVVCTHIHFFKEAHTQLRTLREEEGPSWGASLSSPGPPAASGPGIGSMHMEYGWR